jgi:HemX protein
VDSAIKLLSTLLPMLYALAVAAYALDFFKREPLAACAARRLMNGVVSLHGLFLVALTVRFGHVPLATPPEVLSSVAFAVAVTYLWVERRTKVLETGLFVVSLPLVLQTLSSAFLDSSRSFPEVLKSPLFVAHTISAVVGYAAFAVSAVYGVLFFLLYHELKATRFGLIYQRLPPLETLTRMSVRAVAVGVLFLALTIVNGSIWAQAEFPRFRSDPKFLLTIAVFVAYAAVLLLHRGLRFSPRRTIGASLAAFVLLVVSAVVTRLWPDSFHVFFR